MLTAPYVWIPSVEDDVGKINLNLPGQEILYQPPDNEPSKEADGKAIIMRYNIEGGTKTKTNLVIFIPKGLCLDIFNVSL